MRVYFTASISGRVSYQKTYETIVGLLKDLGCEVISDHILKADPQKISLQNDKERLSYYKKMIEMISKSDIVVAEISTSSLNVGHEVTVSLEKGKAVIALYDRNLTPNLLKGISSEKFQLIPYDLQNLEDVLKKSLAKAKGNIDIRFNFFISPLINDYLDWVSKEKRIPRAVYLRDLLEKEMRRNSKLSSKSS